MNKVLAFLICFIVGFSLFSQSEAKVALEPILKSLKNKHQVIFSYDDKTIENVTITPLNNSLTLDEALKTIEAETNITFTDLGNGYITIIPILKTTSLERRSLEEVILTSYLAKGIKLSKDGSITINYNNFGILPGLIEADALKTAQALPGIESTDETVTNLSIRGGTHDQNLILWDGIKMYQSGHFFGLISAFNPNLTAQTTVYKNGTPTKFTDGVSGTLALQSSNNLNDSLTGGIGLNLIYAEGFFDVPLGKSSLQVSARQSLNTLFTTPTYDSYFDTAFQDTEIDNSGDNITITDDNFDCKDVSLRWLYQISDNDQLKINGLYVDNSLNFQENTTVNNEEESRSSGTKQLNLAGGISYTRQWQDNFKTELKLSGSSYNLEALNADIFNNQRLIQTNEVLETALQLNTNLRIKERWHLDSGYHLTETGITNSQDVDNPLFRRTQKDVIREHAVYIQSTHQTKGYNTYVSIGGRFNYLDKFKRFIAEPRLALSHKLSKSLTLNVQAELKHQTATQVIEFQNDFLGVENRRWILADNDSIPIVQSKQVSIGLSYKQKGWLLSAEGYLKHVDGITTQSQGFQNQFRFSKTNGSYEVFGIEALLMKSLNNFKTWLTYSYTENDYTFENLQPSNFPNNNHLEHSASFGISYTKRRFKISGGIQWRSGKPVTLPNAEMPVVDGNIQFEAPNSSNLSEYFRADVSATYNFKLFKRFNALAGISLWNILSTNNTVNAYYRPSGNNTALLVEQNALGFTPNASLKVLF